MKQQFRSILHEAGEIMLSAREIQNKVQEKEGSVNFVTVYDVAVQHLLQEKLLALCPGSHFIGEEEDMRDDVFHGTAFIVDPIDGTTNFIKGMNASAISVAMLEGGVVVRAAVLDPYRQEFFYAERGKGVTCNDVPIRIAHDQLANSLVLLGTSPYYPDIREKTMALMRVLYDKAMDFRRSGSAVIDLCQLARGSAGLFFEWRLSPWDHAACSLFVEEAGGRISQMDGSPIVFDRPCSILAGSPEAYEDFFTLGLDRI